MVLVTAVAQFVLGSFGGSGALGRPIGEVSAAFETPIVPAGGAFAIWGLIYLGVLVLAVRQVLPAQRSRPVHRATGWWLVGAAIANMAWIALFSQVLPGLAEIAIIALLVCLAVVLARLATGKQSTPTGGADRWLLAVPVAFYAGWVSVATVVGTAATGVWAGLPGTGGVATLLGVVMLVVTGLIAAAVATAGPAPVAYALAVLWALGGIVVAGRPAPVVVAALVAAVLVLAAVVRRLVAGRALREQRPARVA
jgi:translocator protein